MTAPIVLFVYNRPWHTQQTVESLQKNELAKDSELYIFSDEAKNENIKEDVDRVREYLYNINGFKKVTIIERKKNLGLADSIIDGVTAIVNKYGRIIVLEDDMVTSPYFLRFMNEALDFYEKEKKVWHISGWNYPIEIDDTNYKDKVFFIRVMNCWGWATWNDRWKYFEKNVEKILNDFSKEEIKKFNLDDSADFWDQVIFNKKGLISTWAIFWYATIFKQRGLCLNPIHTFVENIGLDSSGENCGNDDKYNSTQLNSNKIDFIDLVKESNIIVNKIKIFYKMNRSNSFKRALNKFYSIINKI